MALSRDDGPGPEARGWRLSFLYSSVRRYADIGQVPAAGRAAGALLRCPREGEVPAEPGALRARPEPRPPSRSLAVPSKPEHRSGRSAVFTLEALVPGA